MHTASLFPPLRPGLRARTRAIFPYKLPAGLPAGTAVTVEEVGPGKCQVRDDDGKLWSVPVMALDAGFLVWKSGHWVQEEASAA
jgi:hypothetical protein